MRIIFSRHGTEQQPASALFAEMETGQCILAPQEASVKERKVKRSENQCLVDGFSPGSQLIHRAAVRANHEHLGLYTLCVHAGSADNEFAALYEKIMTLQCCSRRVQRVTTLSESRTIS